MYVNVAGISEEEQQRWRREREVCRKKLDQARKQGPLILEMEQEKEVQMKDSLMEQFIVLGWKTSCKYLEKNDWGLSGVFTLSIVSSSF